MTDYTSGYTTLQVKQWRAMVYDYTAMVDGIGSGSKLYCLTNFQAMWLQQNIDYMRWSTRWDNLTITSAELGVMADDLEYALMTCVDLKPSMVEFVYNEQQKILLQTYNDKYNLGGITELNANTPTDFFNGDDSIERQDALCTALNIYVRTYSENWVSKAQTYLGIVVITGIVASISIVGGIIASVLVSGLALFTQTALNAFTDNEAINSVVCCMRYKLEGLVVTQANFMTALDSCGFTVGSNEAIIRDIIASDLDQWDNYLSFLNALGDAYVLTQVGVNACVCDTDEFIYTANFSDPLPSCVAITVGTQEASGIRSINAPNPFPGGTGNQDYARVLVNTPDAIQLTDVIVTYDRITSPNNSGLSGSIRNNDLSVTYVNESNFPLGIDNTLQTGPENISNVSIIIRGGMSGAGNGFIKSVQFIGLKSENGGVNPFDIALC